MSAPDRPSWSRQDRTLIATLTRRAVRHAVRQNAPLPLVVADCATKLRAPGASFVTLERAEQLRGCIGTLEATRPLAEDLVANAYAAALKDPRFPPVQEHELDGLDISVSLLSAPEPLPADDETALLKALRPGCDGLIIASALGRATFLPAVWEQLPDPVVFLQQLKRKAGWAPGGWPRDARAARYTVERIDTGKIVTP